MIPLLRPRIPDPVEWIPYLEISKKDGIYSNGGPCFEMCIGLLKRITGQFSTLVSSGTAALQLAATALWPRGSKIAVPDFTFVGSVCALLAAGMEPVLVPVDPSTWTVDLNYLEMNDFDGWMIVSPFGHKVDFKAYDALADRLGKKILYDLAGAWGMPASTRHMKMYSLSSTKNMSTGEGGILVSENGSDITRCRELAHFDLAQNGCRSPYGINAKMDEIRCAILLSELQRPSRVAARISGIKDLRERYMKSIDCFKDTLHVGGAPSLCVLRFSNLPTVEEAASGVFAVKRYYSPLISDMTAFSGIKTLGKSIQMKNCIAFPRDVTEEEFVRIVDALSKSI